MPSRHYVDAGYEPWARGSVKRRGPLTQEQAEDLIATIDHLRGLLDQQDGQLRGLMSEAAGLRAHVAQLEAVEFRKPGGIEDEDEDES